MENFLAFALSYLANSVPSINALLNQNRSLEDRINACFDRARKQWKNKATREQYEGKAFSHLNDLKEYLNGNFTGLDSELEELIGRWVVELKMDPICAGFINEFKTDKLLSDLGSNKETLSKVNKMVDSFGDELSTISAKLDDSISTTKDLERHIEEGNRIILQRIDEGSHFWENWKNDDPLVLINDYFSGKIHRNIPSFTFNGSSLTDKKLWTDEDNEKRIVESLPVLGMYLVKGAEGRGKSILCLKVAYQFYLDGYLVFITKKSWDWDAIHEFVEEITYSDVRAVIILEDIHKLSTDSNDVISFINDYRKGRKRDGKPNNTLFLINLRPSNEGESKSLINTIPSDYYLNLASEVQASRARGLTDFLVSVNHLDLDQLRIEEKPLATSIPPNLKVLTAFFDVYTDPYDSSNVATESKVLHLYTRNYGIEKPKQFQIKTLGLLGALGSFDAPVDTAFLSEEEVLLLFAYADQGLCYYVDSKFYMSHSTDARFLCLALSHTEKEPKSKDSEFVVFVSEAIKRYYLRIVDDERGLTEEKKKDVAKDFVILVINSLYRKKDFAELYGYFRDINESNRVIRICPTFIIPALYSFGDVSKGRLRLFLDNLDFLRSHITSISAPTLHILTTLLSKYYQYNDTISDLFGDPDGLVLTDYLGIQGKGIITCKLSRLKRAIMSLSEKHSRILSEYLTQNRDEISKKKKRIFQLPQSSFKSKSGVAQHEIYLMKKQINEGITIPGLHDQLKQIMEIVKENVSRFPGRESPTNLSKIFHFLGSLDYGLYQDYVQDRVFCGEVLYDVSLDRINTDYLYFYSHFFRQGSSVRDQIIQFLSSQTPTKRWEMQKWLHRLRSNNPSFEPSEGSLAYVIERVLNNSLVS